MQLQTNSSMRNESRKFLVCPRCLAAFPDEKHTVYSCQACRHEWQAPVNSLNGAYFAGINEIAVSLTDISGEEFRLGSFPVTIGRNSDFKALQHNVSVSRQHCIIDFDAESNRFYVTALKTGSGTYLNGQPLTPLEQKVITPGDTLVLSGVVLQLKCRLLTDRGVTAVGTENSKPVPLKKCAPMGYLSSDAEGKLKISAEQPENPIALFTFNSDRNIWQVLAIDREKISVNGESFIEKKLPGGENIAVGGEIFIFDPAQKTLFPAKFEQGADIRISGLCAGYGKKVILGNITCNIPQGKLTAILGQSGCGKSTFIKILSGQKTPQAGSITVNDESLDYSKWLSAHLAVVPQHDIVHPELTVRQCIDYAAAIRMGNKTDSRTRKAVVEKIIRDTDLSATANSAVGSLSGGQRKRVNIAVELTGQPEVLLLDEPTTGLDYATEKSIIANLHRLSRQGKTVVFVTHSLATVEAADHVIVLKNTRNGSFVAAEGTPAEVQNAIGIESWEELYSNINEHSSSADIATEKRKAYHAPGMSALFSRYLMIWLNYPLSSLLLLGALPLLLGIMIRFAVSIDAPMGVDRLVFGLVAMFWLGMNQTVREIVREKEIFLQERSAHVSSWSYLASKLIFFFILTFLQSFLMTLPIMWLNVNSEEFFLKFDQLTCPFTSVLPMMWAAGISGCVLGLFFSSISLFIKNKGEIAAVLFAVIATLPQFLFSAKVLPDGLAKPLKPEHFFNFICWNENAPLAEFLSYFTFSRYLYLPLDAISSGLKNAHIFKAFVFNCGILLTVSIITVICTWLTLELFTIRNRKK